MINQKELSELIDQIIIAENIKDMYQEEGKRKMVNYYDGKVVGFYSALEILGCNLTIAVGMVLMEREKKLKRKEEQKGKTTEEEVKNDQ